MDIFEISNILQGIFLGQLSGDRSPSTQIILLNFLLAGLCLLLKFHPPRSTGVFKTCDVTLDIHSSGERGRRSLRFEAAERFVPMPECAG